jgi:cytochrome c554/c'-like protein
MRSAIPPKLAMAGWLCCAIPICAALQDAGQAKPWDLKAPAPVPDGRIAKLEDLSKDACAMCHTEVANEWAATTHALAWVDPIYKEEVAEKKKPEACWGCHIPKPLHLSPLGVKPEAREDSKEDPRGHGVSCESCHLGPDGAILGPWGEATPAHPTKKVDTMVEGGSTALCATCHKINIGPVIGIAKDFEGAGQAARGRSCVGCHWAPVERAWANPPPEGSGLTTSESKPRPGRSHATQTPRDPAFLRRAIEATVRVEGSKTVVTLRNATGHRVPGLIGRSLELTASVCDAGGKTLAEKKVTFDTRAHLPVDQTSDIVLEAVGKDVHLVGIHHDPRLEKPVPFLDVRLTPAGH